MGAVGWIGGSLIVVHGVNSVGRALWAVRRGFRGVEVDVAPGRGGGVVCCHVSEDGVAVGLVRGVGVGCRGCGLGRVLGVLPRDVVLFLDCKVPWVCVDAVGVAVGMGFGRVYAVCRDHRVLGRVSSLFPGVGVLASLDSRLVGLAGYLESIGASGVSIRALYVDEGLVGELHGRGLVVAAWVVDDPLLAGRLAGWGVDFIVSGRPLRLVGSRGRFRVFSWF